MNRKSLKISLGLMGLVAALPLLADVEWKYVDNHPADDAIERTAMIAGSKPWTEAAFAVDSGAFCEAVTEGCAFDSTRLGTMIIIR